MGPRVLTMGDAIRLEKVGVRFGRVTALRDIDARFEVGSMTAVVGPNGAGKSTLLRAIMGLVRLSGGRISRSGDRASAMSYLPQAAEIDRSFPIDVIDLVSLGAWSRTGLFRSVEGVDSQRVREAIARVGLTGIERTPIGQLSGGQLQRALFARMIVQDARIVLLDEPFAAVDAATILDLMSLLREWHDEGRTIVAVLHDMHLARRDFADTLLLDTTVLAHGASREVLTPETVGATTPFSPATRLVAA